jgi:hypothetical protein
MTATPSPTIPTSTSPSPHSNPPLFPLGQLLATPGAIALLNDLGRTPFEFVTRHRSGDWGALDEEDVQANVAALHYGYRLLSSYDLGGDGQKLWIITEADRSATTLLLPEEY